MEKAGIQKVTVTENQQHHYQKRLKKLFGHLDPDNPPANCPIRDVMAPIADKWSILSILFLGGYGKLRFNEIKRKLYGVSAKVLSDKLGQLEKDGYVSRQVFPEVPIRVEYQLTSLGYQYLEQLLDISEWISEVMPEVLENRNKIKIY
ncbi:winged helix-turn-helix transcriptional regulator [Aquiflexum sp.]|uniref:winged helix-turn-helix transcriptional regulator n=1 Tax=Aquiflexum sp. TaxID=1872584 RepID=UPI003593B1E1